MKVSLQHKNKEKTQSSKSTTNAMDDSKIEAMIKEADTDGDGAINYEEFLRMMMGKDRALELKA